MIVVVPPHAAARVPVSKVSEAAVPPKGSSMWVWASMPPGMTYLPVASTTASTLSSRSTPSRLDRGVRTAAMVSPSTKTSATAIPVALITVPPLMRVVLTATPSSRLRDQGVGVGAAVAIELPGVADLPDHVQVQVADHDLLLGVAAHPADHVALWVAELARPVE